MTVLFFPKLTRATRRSMQRRLDQGSDPAMIARQYGVSLRWLMQQFPALVRRAA